MKFIFFLLGLLAYFMGYFVFTTAKSSIHETVSLLIIINGTLFIVGAGILDAMHANKVKNEPIVKESKNKPLKEKIEPTFTSLS